MFFGNGNLNLVYRKCRNQWENSTQSLTIKTYEAYSYAEKIVYTDSKKGYALLNDHNFSVTTSNHQTHAFCFHTFNHLEKFRIDCYSMNNFDGENLESLGSGVTYTEGLEKFAFKFFPKQAKKYIEKIKLETAKREKAEKEYQNKRASEKRLESNLKNLNYKTLKGFKNAIKKALENHKYMTVHFKLSWDYKAQKYQCKKLENAPIEFLKLIKEHCNKNEKAKNDLFYLENDLYSILENKLNLETLTKLGD